MDKDHKAPSIDKRAQQNARGVAEYPPRLGAWDGPFTAGPCDDWAEGGEYDGVAVFSADDGRQPFALIDDDLCIGGRAGAKARATRIAESLNRDQHLFERGLIGDPEAEEQHLQTFWHPPLPEETLDRWWDRLDDAHGGHGQEIRYITRNLLVEFATDVALAAIDQLVDHDVAGLGNPVGALSQSLKVMAEARSREGAEGHAVIANRARLFIDRASNDVTRFLESPGLFMRHPTIDADLRVEAVVFYEDGRIMCRVVTMSDEMRATAFPLAELTPAGPVDDAIRAMTVEIARGLAGDMVTTLIGLDTAPLGEAPEPESSDLRDE